MRRSIWTDELPNGLRLAAEHMPHLPSVSWTLLVEAGSAGDPEGRSGMAQLLSGMVVRGAGERDARAFSDALDALGVHRGGGVDREYLTFSGACLAADLPDALPLFADMLQRAHLPRGELDAERALALQALDSLQDNPTQRLFVEIEQIYFPGRFGRPRLGSASDINGVDSGDLAADYQRRFRPRGAILAVAGGAAPGTVRQLAEELFGIWDGGTSSQPRATPRDDGSYTHFQQDTAQTQVGVVYPGLALGDPDYYRARLALNVLSGGMGSRLFREVREKRGLAYSVSAFARLHRGAGVSMAYAGTQPERAQETVDVLAGELRRITEGVTEDELDRARTGLLSSLVMQGESSPARAAAIASDIFLAGRPRTLEEISAAVQAITLDDLNTYLRERQPGPFTVVTLGPAPVTSPA